MRFGVTMTLYQMIYAAEPYLILARHAGRLLSPTSCARIDRIRISGNHALKVAKSMFQAWRSHNAHIRHMTATRHTPCQGRMQRWSTAACKELETLAKRMPKDLSLICPTVLTAIQYVLPCGIHPAFRDDALVVDLRKHGVYQ